MNVKDLHTKQMPVSATSLFKSDLGNATAIQILAGEKLKEHSSQTPALLLCLEGKTLFEDENGMHEILQSGDYVNIQAGVKHKMEGVLESQLILIK
jgi:quercetin dioxygenase-like cupin family protein